MQDDDFSALPQAEFDGVVFPVTSVRLTHGSALAFHKFPHRPGQRIEPTGREPVAGQMVAPMFADLVLEGSGRTAFWPTGVQLLREKAQQQKPARLVVPTFGTLERAFIRVDESVEARQRNGATLTIAFFEDSSDIIAKGTAPSAAARVSSLAFDLDTHLAALKLALMQRLEDGLGNTFGDFATSCAAMVAMKDNAQASLANRITMAGRIVAAIDDLLGGVRSALTDPLGWEAREAMLNLQDAVTELSTEGSAAAAAIKTFTVAARSSAADVATATRNSVEEILSLNALADPTDIAPGEVIVVYSR